MKKMMSLLDTHSKVPLPWKILIQFWRHVRLQMRKNNRYVQRTSIPSCTTETMHLRRGPQSSKGQVLRTQHSCISASSNCVKSIDRTIVGFTIIWHPPCAFAAKQIRSLNFLPNRKTIKRSRQPVLSAVLQHTPTLRSHSNCQQAKHIARLILNLS